VSYKYWDESKGEISLDWNLTDDEIEELATNPKVRSVGFYDPMQPEVFARLEKGLFSRRPEVELRVINHHNVCCDFSFLRDLPSLTRVLLRRLPNIAGLDGFAHLRNLKRLRLEIYELKNCDLFESVTPDLEELCLSPKKYNIDWGPLSRLRNLRRLETYRIPKALEVLPRLPSLNILGLCCMENVDLSVLSAIPALERLRLERGALMDVEFLRALRKLRHLELRGVEWVEDFTPVEQCELLESLYLSQGALRRLPNLAALKNLRSLVLSVGKLESIAPLSGCVSLEYLRLRSASKFRPEDFEPVLQAPRLKAVQVDLGSDPRNQALDAMLAARGLGKNVPEPERFLEDEG